MTTHSKKVNSTGTCAWCFTKSIHYGIKNGGFTYECLKCKCMITRDDVYSDDQITAPAELKEIMRRVKVGHHFTYKNGNLIKHGIKVSDKYMVPIKTLRTV